MKFNPFNPNSPVNTGMFVGRLPELNDLERGLMQTKAGSPAHFMVTGERGIGKTSLLIYLKGLADGYIALSDNSSVKFLVLSLDIDQDTTQLGFVERIQSHLDNELGNSERARQFLRAAWSFIQRVRIQDSGLEADTKQDRDEVLMDKFALSLAKVINRVCTSQSDSPFSAKYDGVLLMIDEADNGSSALRLGSFLKLLIERLTKQNCNHLLIGLAGLPDLRAKLQKDHPSSLRIFHELPLGRLSDADVATVLNVCIKVANDKNTEKTVITTEGARALCALSEGYPHFVQQFGYSAFAADTDNKIDEEDVTNGAFSPSGALKEIGDRYYRDDFYNKIQKESYRQVLRIMADDLDGWVSRNKIATRFKGRQSVLNNAIKALRDRHIILSKEGEKGVYRLQLKGFALWIKLHASGSNLLTGQQQPSETLLGDEITHDLSGNDKQQYEDVDDASTNRDAENKQ